MAGTDEIGVTKVLGEAIHFDEDAARPKTKKNVQWRFRQNSGRGVPIGENDENRSSDRCKVQKRELWAKKGQDGGRDRRESPTKKRVLTKDGQNQYLLPWEMGAGTRGRNFRNPAILGGAELGWGGGRGGPPGKL